MKLLSGHTSPETAYLVTDYPYGFKLRCQARFWLEYNPKHGFRFMYQTTNPKRGNIWNKPKASTYAKFGGAMFLDADNHVHWSSLSEYCDAEEAQKWLDEYGSVMPEAPLLLLRKFVAAKKAYAANRESGDPLVVGLPEARQAFKETK